ncbi:unnamed protein product, partial [Rotaria sp. Silwood1]
MIILVKIQTALNAFSSLVVIIIKFSYFFRFDIDRSVIRLLDRNIQTRENRPSTNTVVRIRTADILGSNEYRELE